MQTSKYLKLFAFFFLLNVSFLCNGAAAPVPVETPPLRANADKKLEGDVQASGIAAQAWLTIADQGKYDQSYEAASNLTHDRISKKDWIKILDKTRKPHGAVNSRSILDIRTAKDPKGLPAGDYMVYFYNTSFANKKLAYELLTLYLENGQWKVVTYQVD